MTPVSDLESRLQSLFRATVADVADVAVIRLPGDASNRSYYRIQGGGNSAIAMVLADNDPHRSAEEIGSDIDEIRELPFLNVLRFLERNELPAPKLFYDGVREGILLLSDLGDETLLDRATPLDEAGREKLYTEAVDTLLAFQRAGLRETGAGDFLGFRRRFDADLFHWEFHHFLEYAIEKKGIVVDPADRERLDAAFRRLSERIATMTPVLVHRDYHSRNLMLQDDRLYLIDFQDALTGAAPYDLASLLRDSYIAVGDPIVDRLVERYRLGAVDAGIGTWGADEFREMFDLVSVQRNLKAAGRFDYIDQVKGNPKFLADIPRTLGYVRENLQRHASLADLRLFGRYVPALA